MLKKDGFATNVGDEGGFAPNFGSATQALDYIMKAIDKAGYKAGDDIKLALDAASSEFYENGIYNIAGEGKKLDNKQIVDYYKDLADRFFD